MCFRMSCVFARHVFSYVICFRASCVFVRHVFSYVMCFRVSCVFVCQFFSGVMYFRVSCVFVCHVFSCVMCFRTSCVFVRHVFSCVMCFLWKYAEAMRKTDYQSQSPCRHAKTVLESFFVLFVYRPHDNGIGVASDKIRKSLLCTVSASSFYRKYYERTNRDIVWDIPDWPDM